MEELLDKIQFWHWWVLAAFLIAIEVFAPTTLFLWTGISAAAVGLVLLVVPVMGWEYQVLVFAALSVASVLAWRSYLRRRPVSTADPKLNRRAKQYVGQQFVLQEPIVGGQARLSIGGVIWRIAGDDVAAGTRVTVVGVDGATLKVERASS